MLLLALALLALASWPAAARAIILPANPFPESLQYVTVFDNSNQGGFAGSEPIKEPQNFRCAFNKSPGAQNNEDS